MESSSSSYGRKKGRGSIHTRNPQDPNELWCSLHATYHERSTFFRCQRKRLKTLEKHVEDRITISSNPQSDVDQQSNATGLSSAWSEPGLDSPLASRSSHLYIDMQDRAVDYEAFEVEPEGGQPYDSDDSGLDTCEMTDDPMEFGLVDFDSGDDKDSESGNVNEINNDIQSSDGESQEEIDEESVLSQEDSEELTVYLSNVETLNMQTDLDFLDWKIKYGVTDTAFDELVKLVNSSLNSGIKLLSYYRSSSALSRLVPFEVQKFECCINSCLLFVGEYKDCKTCPECKHERYKGDSKTPWATFDYVSPFEQIRVQMGDAGRRREFLYRHNYICSPRWKTSLADIFDGSQYVSLHERGFFENKYDMAFSLTTDGFQIFNQ